MWQSRESSNDEWKCYSDIENEIIEDHYKQKKYLIDFNENITLDLKNKSQINRTNQQKKSIEIRRINRENSNLNRNQTRRNDRFCSIPKLIDQENKSNKSLANADWNGSKFVFEWHMKCVDLESRSYADIFKEALQGIRIESQQIGHEHEGQWIVEHYINTTEQSFSQICQTCIYLYTMESFLYHLINKTLRENDLSKLDTLGPFIYLLFQFYFSKEYEHLQYIGCVYRSVYLSSSMIQEYEESIGQIRSWLGLTSTTKQKQIAESFSHSNVLFIIHIQPTTIRSARYIANLSMYPYEDEVLIRSGQHFTVDQVQINADSSSNHQMKTYIYLTIQ